MDTLLFNNSVQLFSYYRCNYNIYLSKAGGNLFKILKQYTLWTNNFTHYFEIV